MTSPITPEAIEAAARAAKKVPPYSGKNARIIAALTAAAPHIAEAERRRIITDIVEHAIAAHDIGSKDSASALWNYAVRVDKETALSASAEWRAHNQEVAARSLAPIEKNDG